MATTTQELYDLRTEITLLQQKIQDLSDRTAKASERCVIFIDNTNLNLSSRKLDPQGGYRFCYNKLITWLTNGRLLRQARIYYSDFGPAARLNSEDASKRQEREKFYEWLRYQGYYLKSCALVEGQDGALKEKGLDSSITRDVERLARLGVMDTIILVAGDGDYKELVAGVQADYGVKVECAFFPEFTATVLKRESTVFVDLTKAKDLLRRSNSNITT